MPKASQPSFSPLRLFTPIQLMACLVLFFLPWIELQCALPSSITKQMPKEKIDEAKKELGIDPTKPVSMVTQSGLQIATGNSSAGSDMKKIQDSMKKSGMNVDLDPNSANNKSKDSKDDLKGAPLLFAYPLLLVAGMAIAFVPLPSMVRRLVLAGCCFGALGVVGLQAAIGFPMENDLKKQNEQMKALGGFGAFGPIGPDPPAAPPNPKGKGGKTEPKPETKTDTKVEGDIFRVSWQIPLYITLLLLLGATGTAFLDSPGAGGKARYGYGRKSQRDDYDEYAEDEEDERPCKKRRDEEEDDRPRKKKQEEPLSLDDDEDDRPRKKKRDDEDDRPRKRRDDDEDRPRKRRDEDEDDRPRKKKRDGDDFPMPAASPPPPPPPPPAGPNPFAFEEVDEPPPKKRPRREDDEDDRPRKKRRDDDDDDDRPRKKRRDD